MSAPTDPPAGANHVRRTPLVATLTLGCKLNQAESQSFARRLSAAGCATTDRPAPADAYLINTCTVTHVADRKARRLIRMAKRLAPNATVVVTGCYADWAGERLRAETGADVVLGNAQKDRAVDTLLQRLAVTPRTAELGTPAGGRSRAFIKIQEGCNDVCAFCIVPRVRGRERATPIPEIVREVQQREREGVLEVVFTGTQPGAYGRDRDDGTNAAALLQALLSATTIPRLRYSSIQPQDITADLLANWEDSRLCRHFHLALQSGSDRILRRMRRRYDAALFLAALARIRAAVPGAAITTDVIVGFPGESEADFERTQRLVRDAQFADVHVFPYSPRPGTTASLLNDDVPPALKQARSIALRQEASRATQRFRQDLLGSMQPVLIEGPAPHREAEQGEAGAGRWRGLTDTYVPVEVTAAPPRTDLRNRLVPVRLEQLAAGAITGHVLA